MKLVKAKSIAFVSMVIMAATFFSSCQDVIYYNIRKEVTLNHANIRGDIRSIIRFKNEFFCVNGDIYHKSKDDNRYGTWSKTTSPSGQVLKLAADQSYIYALVGISREDYSKGENVPVRRELWYSDNGSTWKKVTGVYGSGDISYNSSGDIKTYLFGTNSIDATKRSAYFIVCGGAAGYKAYELNGASVATTWGTGTGEVAPATTTADTKPVVNALAVSQSCVSCGGTVRFFNSTGSCTNEKASGASTAATIYYYGDGSTLRWGGAKSGSIGTDGSVYSLGYTSDYLLVGTTKGMTHHLMTNETPGSSSREFVTNAAATMSKQYTILSILVVNPECKETETAIYTSQNYQGNGSDSAQFEHICLWAYYPYRREWNRE